MLTQHIENDLTQQRPHPPPPHTHTHTHTHSHTHTPKQHKNTQIRTCNDMSHTRSGWAHLLCGLGLWPPAPPHAPEHARTAQNKYAVRGEEAPAQQ